MARRATIQAVNAHQAKEGASLEQKAANAKAERGKRCMDELQAAITAICQKHNCGSGLVVQIGNELRPLEQVLTLPVSLSVTPLDIAPAPAKAELPSPNGAHKEN